MVCCRLFRTKQSIVLSRKLLTRRLGETLAVWRDLEARQLGGMDEMKMLNLSWSASSKAGFQSDLPSLIAGTNCSLAIISREKRASFDQNSMESARINHGRACRA